MVKNPPANTGDLSSIPGLGRSPGGGHGNPLTGFLPAGSPQTEDPGVQQSMESPRVRHD